MKPACPLCSKNNESSENRTNVVRFGSFRRKSDSRRIRRFLCQRCYKTFSFATTNDCVDQKKRQFNEEIRKHLASGVSQRRSARILNLNRKTIVRKFIFLGLLAEAELARTNAEHPPSPTIEFDDLETFEHTKMKPLSVTLAVEHGTRRILGFEVSQMAANGPLAKKSVKKYGPRKDRRREGRRKLFEKIKPLVDPKAQIKSDQNPHYPEDVKRLFPEATHVTYKSRKGSNTGQGELKKIGYDPLFTINHTFAMLRANINRLFRKTWCTTKLRKDCATISLSMRLTTT